MDELTIMEVELVEWRINESTMESETVYGRTEEIKKKSMDLSGQTKNWWAEV